MCAFRQTRWAIGRSRRRAPTNRTPDWKEKTAIATDVGCTSVSGYVNITSVPTDIDFRVRHNNGASIDFTLEYGNINVLYVGKSQ